MYAIYLPEKGYCQYDEFKMGATVVDTPLEATIFVTQEKAEQQAKAPVWLTNENAYYHNGREIHKIHCELITVAPVSTVKEE